MSVVSHTIQIQAMDTIRTREQYYMIYCTIIIKSLTCFKV